MQPRLATCILITLANTSRRETNCIPRRGRSERNYMTSHNSVSSSRSAARHCPSFHDTHNCRPKHIDSLTQRHVQISSLLSFKRSDPRRTCGDPFPRRDILPTFFYLCMYVCVNKTWASCPHSLQCSLSPPFSRALQTVLSSCLLALQTRSPSTDRWELDGSLGCFKRSSEFPSSSAFLRTVIQYIKERCIRN